MKNVVLLISMSLLSVNALAQKECEPTNYVAEEYGIDFGGMVKAVPVADTVEKLPTVGQKLYSIQINRERKMVPDGFFYRLLLAENTKKGWIQRTGGFAHPPVVLGPIELPSKTLKNCKYEVMYANFAPKTN
jgi:hypothetical protein